MNLSPLQGIKVLDLSMLLPGPLCTMYLGDMGANVIKVENPRGYDGTRAMFKNEAGVPGLYLMLNRNKKSITLNLKKEKSKEILYQLLEDTDILIEGFRPDAMDGMGYGYESLKEKFPRLIYCGLYGYGSYGQYKDYAGHDANYLALSGILELTGSLGASPSLSGFQLADIGGGSLVALSSILAALYMREKTGRGQKVDVSMMESSLQFMSLYLGIYLSTGKVPERGNELLTGKLPNYCIYPIQNGRYVVLGALEEKFFQVFLRNSSLDISLKGIDLVPDNFSKIKEVLSNFFLSKNITDLEPLFKNKDACLTLIKTMDEVIADPYFKERGMIFTMKHPEYGEILQLGSPFKLSEGKPVYTLPPPALGQHNEEVYSNLGYSQTQIEELRKERVL
jgi:alpha-methylacyl-CoA racemase